MQVEVGLRRKTLTLPFVLLQLYLPFSDLRFIYQLIKNDCRMMTMKKKYDISMSTIGMLYIHYLLVSVNQTILFQRDLNFVNLKCPLVELGNTCTVLLR